MRQQVFQVGDLLEQLLVFVLQLAPFQRGQAPQLHVEDGLGLDFGELKIADEVVARRFRILAAANGLDNLIQNIQRAQQTL